jgi:hypothetical protein
MEIASVLLHMRSVLWHRHSGDRQGWNIMYNMYLYFDGSNTVFLSCDVFNAQRVPILISPKAIRRMPCYTTNNRIRTTLLPD